MQTITISTPSDNLVVSENGNAEKQPQQTSGAIDKLVIANISLVVWLVFLAIGGGILALYYARIGYLPEIEWKASLVYLFVGSMIGGAIGLLLIISLFIPGVLWSEFIIFDPALERHFSYDLENKEPCMRSITTYLGKPFLVLLLVSHLMLLVGRASIFWILAVGLLVVTFWLMRLRFESIFLASHLPRGKARKTRTTSRFENAKRALRNAIRALRVLHRRRKVNARRTFKYSSWFTLSVFLSQVSMYVIYRLSGSIPISLRFIALTMLCTSGVWISNHVVAFYYHHSPRQAVVVSLVAAGLLLVTADNFSSLSVRLLNHFGIGYNRRVNLLVNDHGSEILCGLRLTECGTDRLYNVEILSKMGNQYYLKIAEKTYITLPKDDVRAFSYTDQELDLAQPLEY
jgi:hypothetical protein